MITATELLADIDRKMAALGPSPTQALPSLFGGMRWVESPAIEPVLVGHHIDMIPESRNRSRRVFKKLAKRRRANAKPMRQHYAYVMGGQMFVPTMMAHQLRQSAIITDIAV